MLNLRQIAELSKKEQRQMKARCNYDNSKILAHQKTNKRIASAKNQIEAGVPEREVKNELSNS